MKKKVISILISVTIAFSFVACSNNDKVDSNNMDNETSISVEDAETKIVLGEEISIDGSGATVDGSKVVINASGTYSVEGTLTDGQIIVDAQDIDRVQLFLNGVDITSSNTSPIYVKNCDKTILTVVEGTTNKLSDGESYVLENQEENEPNACIYSKDDLTINGKGDLEVNGNYDNGITCKDDLKINGTNLVVNAVNNGIRGKDSVIIKDGDITVDAGGDGIKSNNDTDTEKGYIVIENGIIKVTSGEDGIQAETNLSILDGDINITSGGGSVNSSKTSSGEVNENWGKGFMGNNTLPKGDMPQMDGMNPGDMKAPEDNLQGESSEDSTDKISAKGIKASGTLKIEGGTINIDSSDDSIHSNDTIVINNGTINLSSGDDGIHADTKLEINSGDIKIEKSYEGLEASEIVINEGNIDLVASDDGINAAGGNDSSSLGGRPGENSFSASNGSIEINGGKVYIDASGDGVDSNGSITMTNGLVIVNGPTNSGNGALDYNGSFDISGGTLVAAGSAGMAQTPSSSSSEYSVSINASVSAGTLVNIKSQSGEEVITFAPSKDVQSIVVASPNIKEGETYTVSSGGTYSSEGEKGLYTEGSYSDGTEIGSFTASSSASTVGTAAGGMDKGFPGDMNGKGNRRGGM